MRCVDVGRAEAMLGSGGLAAPVVYVIDLPEHPFDVAAAARGLAANVVRVPVRDWCDSLTPWPAPGLREGEKDFGGRAAETLAELTREAIPVLEERYALVPVRRAICGYSLGGLFSLYAFARDARFSACACLSGSLWYPGWVDYLRDLPLDGAGRYAYLSLGKKECKAGPRVMRSVQDNTEACARVCRERGCAVDYVLGPGNHMQHHTERLAAGLAALDAFLLAVD
ncbi:alpha/beta hydrolase-fold protein [Thermophilibacter sp.]